MITFSSLQSPVSRIRHRAQGPLLLPLLWLCLFTFGFGAASARAATVQAYVQPATARPNQVIVYVIVVRDGQLDRVPALRFPLQITQATGGPSTSQQFQIINGQRTASLQISWGIVASEPGDFVIPQQEVQVDGQIIKTNEVKLTVGQGGPGPGKNGQDANESILQIELGKKEVYQGEVVPVSCSLYVPRRTPLRRMGLIDIEKNDFAIARFPQQSEQTATMIDNIGYSVMTFRSTLSSLRTGELKVGPATMEILVEMPIDGAARPEPPPGFPPAFQGFFGTPSEPRKIIVKSQQVTLKVLPLPEGKPASFSGAVGDFRMHASATPTDGAVGDPIAVELFIEGTGNFDALSTPSLTVPQGWKLYPPKRYNIEGQMDQNEVPTLERKIGYALVLVPETMQQTLPPFEISYFSPTKKAYEILKTEPIALAMKPAPAAAASESSAGVAGAAAAPPPVVAPQPDITDIVVRPPAQAHWLAASGNLLVRSPLFWAVQSVPVGLLALAGLVAFVRRRREAERAGMAGELRQAWAALEDPQASDPEFLRRAAQLIQRAQGSAAVKDPALKAILDRYQSSNFSAAAAPALSKAERQGIVQTLAPLLRSSLARTAALALAGLGLFSSHLLGAEAAKPTPAEIRAASPDDVYKQAIGELEKGNFTRAQYLGESLTKRKPPQLSPEVFEIIGHSRYRQEDMGRAVLWYERAQLFNPRSPELRQNLRHLTERLRYLSFAESSPLKEWSYYLSPNEWVVLAAGGLWLALLSIAWRIFSGKRHAVLAVVISMIGLTIAVPATALAALRPPGAERVKDIHIVTATEARAYTAATVTSGTVIDLPPGSQVRLLERRGAWGYVEIPNEPESLRGWVEMGAVTPFWIWDEALVP